MQHADDSTWSDRHDADELADLIAGLGQRLAVRHGLYEDVALLADAAAALHELAEQARGARAAKRLAHDVGEISRSLLNAETILGNRPLNADETPR